MRGVRINPEDVWEWAFEAEDQYQIPASLLMGLVQKESSFLNGVRGGVGEIGIAQFRPETAKEMGIDPSDPRQAVLGAAKYLRTLSNWLKGNQHVPTLLAAYNWGVGNVKRKGLGRMPRSTRNYIADINAYSRVFEKQLQAMGGREGWQAKRKAAFEPVALPDYSLEE